MNRGVKLFLFALVAAIVVMGATIIDSSLSQQVANVEYFESSPGAGGTLTIAAVAGRRHGITLIRATRSTPDAVTGNTVLDITSTNLPDGISWRVGNALAAGETALEIGEVYWTPMVSSVDNTATTIVFPDPDAAGTTAVWSVAVHYIEVRVN